MGANQSNASGGKCNYDSYLNKIKKLAMRYTTEKIKNEKISKELKQKTIDLEKKESEITKLKRVCLADDNTSIKETGEKIFKLLSKTYKENLNLYHTQKKLLEKQNKVLGDKSIIDDKLKNKLSKLDDNIVKNERLLELHGEDDNEQKNYIQYLVYLTIFLVIFIIFLSIWYYRY